jgi:probable rRNA maturation factor
MGKINFEVTTTLKGTLPRVPFANIKREILGDSYELSLVLIGDRLGTRLNAEYKKEHIPTNVLSFPISKSEGEIFLNVRRAQRDAKKWDLTEREYIAFLFIHGCLHLTGQTHSKKMECTEEKLLTKLLK